MPIVTALELVFWNCIPHANCPAAALLEPSEPSARSELDVDPKLYKLPPLSEPVSAAILVPVPVLWAYQAAIVESSVQVPVPVLIKPLKSCVYVPEAVIDTGAACVATESANRATISATHQFVNPKFDLMRVFFIFLFSCFYRLQKCNRPLCKQ
ncbi:MAG: hypothetical protein EBT07_10765 [Actinobacteria bacterium]|nr:hypothetical protein [Actinomycetota bacterium]